MSQRKQRKKINQEGIDYWKSSSDLMTALILVLLLVIMFLVLYILDKPDEHFDQTYENTYESETDYEGGDGENIDDNIGDKDGESFSDDDGRDDDDGIQRFFLCVCEVRGLLSYMFDNSVGGFGTHLEATLLMIMVLYCKRTQIKICQGKGCRGRVEKGSKQGASSSPLLRECGQC